jgi:hypothetical protein
LAHSGYDLLGSKETNGQENLKMGRKVVLGEVWEYFSADAAMWSVGCSTAVSTSPKVFAPKAEDPKMVWPDF